MELHAGKPVNPDDYEIVWNSDVEDFFRVALRYAEDHHKDTLEYYRNVKLEDVQPHSFWSDYVWCVYTSGFNAKVVSKHFKVLMDSYGPWNLWMSPELIWKKVSGRIGNRKKFDSILKCRELLRSLGWQKFRETYCQTPATLRELPFVGKITCFHLARNIGMECVKPDVHLVRVAKNFKFDDPHSLCDHLSTVFFERIGVVDFAIWAWCAAFGSK